MTMRRVWTALRLFRRQAYGMRTLEASRRTIRVVFVLAIALMATAWSEPGHAGATKAAFAVLAFTHLALTIHLRAVIDRDRELLATVGGAMVVARHRWDVSWVILVGDALVTMALVIVAVLSLG